jgi:hypothetical protein
MAKNPIRGKTKTRLATTVGEEKAMEVYRDLLDHTSKVACSLEEITRFVFYSDYIERADMFADKDFRKYVQCNGDLGTRMEYAFSIPFKNEYRKVVIIGTDCIDLNSDIIRNAFESLDKNDFVIGPAKDGGYYLLGMKKWNRWVFKDKPWSTERLYELTTGEMRTKGASIFELEMLSDIDTLEDLQSSSLASKFSN